MAVIPENPSEPPHSRPMVSLESGAGDLFISFLKRLAKLKDTGNILPGHGGILDRVDGILFAAPVGLLLLDYLSIN